MTSALRIFSNRAVSRAGVPVLAFALGLPAVASTVSGSVELMNSQDPLVRKHKDYSGVVVWLEALNGTLAAGKTTKLQIGEFIGASRVPAVHLKAFTFTS